MNSNTTKLPLTLTYSPISIGKLRLILHVEHAMRALKQFGFTSKDIDEVKGIFSEANLYLLCGTMLIASVHVRRLHFIYVLLFCCQTNFLEMILILFLFSFFLIFSHSKMISLSGEKRRPTWVFQCVRHCGEHLVKLLYFCIYWTSIPHS